MLSEYYVAAIKPAACVHSLLSSCVHVCGVASLLQPSGTRVRLRTLLLQRKPQSRRGWSSSTFTYKRPYYSWIAPLINILHCMLGSLWSSIGGGGWGLLTPQYHAQLLPFRTLTRWLLLIRCTGKKKGLPLAAWIPCCVTWLEWHSFLCSLFFATSTSASVSG